MKKSQMSGMPAPTNFSGPAKLLRHNATRKSIASPTTAMVTPHSGTRSDVAGNSNIGNPYKKASDRGEQKLGTTPQIIPHSPLAVPREPKKFNKQKFAMGVPTKLTK